MCERGQDATKRTGHDATGPHIDADQLIMMCTDYRHTHRRVGMLGIDPVSFSNRPFIPTPRGYCESMERRFLNFGDTP